MNEDSFLHLLYFIVIMAGAAYKAIHLFIYLFFNIFNSYSCKITYSKCLNCVLNLKKLLEILPKGVAVMSPGAGISQLFTSVVTMAVIPQNSPIFGH